MKYLLLFTLGFLLAACSKGPDSPRGFSLPEGDVERGEQVFLQYDCLSCHRLQGYDAVVKDRELEKPIVLGGTVTKVKTYAELLTSVINPSHRLASGYERDQVTGDDGESLMRNYNDVMTVSELIDLVAFLEAHYDLDPYAQSHYQMYYP
ncbi:c-type cytochrome [Marinimicrobium locisalis]|uniref:c-type cytochrome n=1 Tax=Marinimicrobium locisalis TaxID=546022 RepID=UPI0032220E5F